MLRAATAAVVAVVVVVEVVGLPAERGLRGDSGEGEGERERGLLEEVDRSEGVCACKCPAIPPPAALTLAPPAPLPAAEEEAGR
jgi:hypothetical protein